MANQSVTQKLSNTFHKVQGIYLLSVVPDLPAEVASNEAACIAESIATVVNENADPGMDSATAYLVALAAEAVQALCNHATETYKTAEEYSPPARAHEAVPQDELTGHA